MSHFLAIGLKLEDSYFEILDEEDSRIIVCAWRDMIQEFCNTHDILDKIHQTYSRARDAAQVYEVNMKMMKMKQRKMIVIGYTSQLKML